MNHRFFKLLQILIIGFFALILPESKAKSPGLIPKKSTDKPVPRILKLLTPDESGVVMVWWIYISLVFWIKTNFISIKGI